MLDLFRKADDDNNTFVFIIVGGTIGGILLGMYIAQQIKLFSQGVFC